MQTVRLGRTNIVVSKNGFGALPIQRVTSDEAVRILRKAYEGGINYFDTARFYTDSEEKLGLALADVRENIIISTKTMQTNVEGFWRELEESLTLLKTDYIDIYQFHNPAVMPKPDDGIGMYEAIFSGVDGLASCLLIFNVPFTFFKGVVITLVTFLIYKHISPIIKGNSDKKAKNIQE